MKRSMLAMTAAVLLTGCAGAVQLQGLVADDVVRAQAIAQAANDPAGVACAQAIAAHVAAQTPPLEPVGVFSSFMAARELHRRVSAGVSENVKNACAPLVLDVETTLAKLGLLVMPGGGVLGGMLK